MSEIFAVIFQKQTKKLVIFTSIIACILTLCSCGNLPSMFTTPTPTLTQTQTITKTIQPTATATLISSPTPIPLTAELLELQALDSIAEMDNWLRRHNWVPSTFKEIEKYGQYVEQTIESTLELGSGDCGEYARLAYFVMKDNAPSYLVEVMGTMTDGTYYGHGIMVYQNLNGTYSYADVNQRADTGNPSYVRSFSTYMDLFKDLQDFYAPQGWYLTDFYFEIEEDFNSYWARSNPDDPTANWITGDSYSTGVAPSGDTYTLPDPRLTPTSESIPN